MNMVILLPHSSCSVHSWVEDVCIAFLWGFMWQSNLHLFASSVLYRLWRFGKQRKKSVWKRFCNVTACLIRELEWIIKVIFSNSVFLQACNHGRCQGHYWGKKVQCSSKKEAISNWGTGFRRWRFRIRVLCSLGYSDFIWFFVNQVYGTFPLCSGIPFFDESKQKS